METPATPGRITATAAETAREAGLGTSASSEQTSVLAHPLATSDAETSASTSPAIAAAGNGGVDVQSPVLLRFNANTPSTEYVDVGELVVGPTTKLRDVVHQATLLLLKLHDEYNLDLVQKALAQYSPCVTKVGQDMVEKLSVQLRIRDRVLATHNGRAWRCAKTGMLQDEPHVTKKDHNITIKRANSNKA